VAGVLGRVLFFLVDDQERSAQGEDKGLCLSEFLTAVVTLANVAHGAIGEIRIEAPEGKIFQELIAATVMHLGFYSP